MKSNAKSHPLKADLEALAKVRDELCVQVGLAKADARDEWRQLEKSWRLVEEELKRAGSHSKASAKEVGGATRDLIEELKAGYRRLRSQLEHAADHHA